MEGFIQLACTLFAVLFACVFWVILPPIGSSVLVAVLYILPFAIGIWLFNFKLGKFLLSQYHEAITESPKVSPQKSESKKSASTTSSTAHPDTTPYKICRFIWVRSVIFCEQIQSEPSLKCEAYLWTAFFYAITKHIRKQDIVDEIYHQFKGSAMPFISESENTDMVLHMIQSHYWCFRSKLNASGIDPRNHEGIVSLWLLTSEQAFPGIKLSENALVGFEYNINLLVNYALRLYGLKPPEETTYLVEAANSMLVRVPESKLESWETAQSELRKDPTSNPTGLTPEQKEYIKKRILDDIYNPKEE